MKELTAEEFFRNKIKELEPNKEVTMSHTMITAEQGLRWAHEFKELHLQSNGKTNPTAEYLNRNNDGWVSVEEIRELIDANENLPIIAQLLSGWKATTPSNEWTDFDEYCVQALHNIQQINEPLKEKYGTDKG